MTRYTPLIDAIRWTLDPQPIYEAAALLTGAASIFFWLLPLFLAFRVVQEAGSVFSGGNIAQAFADMNYTIVYYIVYATAGWLLFQLIVYIRDYFSTLGSAHFVETALANAREAINSSADIDWVDAHLHAFSNTSTGASTQSFIWQLFQISSLVYVFIKHFLMVLFALLMVMAYVWGFIAISSRVLHKSYNLLPSFFKMVMALGAWVILEPLAMSVVWLMIQPGIQNLIASHSHATSALTAVTLWHAYVAVVLFVTVLVLCLIPMMAYKIVNHTGVVSRVSTVSNAVQKTSYFTDKTALLKNRMTAWVNDKPANKKITKQRHSEQQRGIGNLASKKPSQ